MAPVPLPGRPLTHLEPDGVRELTRAAAAAAYLGTSASASRPETTAAPSPRPAPAPRRCQGHRHGHLQGHRLAGCSGTRSREPAGQAGEPTALLPRAPPGPSAAVPARPSLGGATPSPPARLPVSGGSSFLSLFSPCASLLPGCLALRFLLIV